VEVLARGKGPTQEKCVLLLVIFLLSREVQ
jgi:hypothetical protein